MKKLKDILKNITQDKNGTKTMTKDDLAKAEKYRRERLEKLLKDICK